MRVATGIVCLILLSSYEANARDARTFLGERLGVSLKGLNVCAAGTKDDDGSCEPINAGANWQRVKSLDSFTLLSEDAKVSISEDAKGSTSNEELINKARAHYIGQLYFDADIDPTCRDPGADAAIPKVGVPAEHIDLAANLRNISVTNTAAAFEAEFKKANSGASLNATATAVFEKELEKEVQNSIRADVIWFTTRFTGGVRGLSKISELRGCFSSYQKYQKVQPKAPPAFITGVAGFLVREASFDFSLTSAQTVNAALRAVLAVEPKAANLRAEARASIQASWKKHVEQYVEIKATKKSIGVTFYPVWVQLQHLPSDFDFASVMTTATEASPHLGKAQ